VLVLPVASLAADLTFAAFFLFAEAVVVWCTFCQEALDRHSRADLVGAVPEAERPALLERLGHAGAYELSVRLLRFAGSALLVAGIAFLVLRGRLAAIQDPVDGRVPFPWGPLGATLAITFVVHFLLNEVVLRLLARRRPEAFLLRALPGLEVLRVVTLPVRFPLVWAVERLFRVRLQDGGTTARDEVLESVEEAEREGTFSAGEAEMIESIMELDLTLVTDVMTPRGDIAMIEADAALDDALAFVVEDGHSRIPVYGNDRDDVLGVLYAHDLLRHARQDAAALRVRDVMRPPFFVPENKPVNDLLAEMRARKVHMAIVLNEFGGTSGLATIEDILEEIVGEIEDEYDEAAPAPPRAENGTLVVDGRTTVEEVNKALRVALPVHDDFETVGGLVFHELGKVPRCGDQLTVGNVAMTVTDADERTVKQLKLVVVP
jgi:CBS domain containing-hemolysin-like protein